MSELWTGHLGNELGDLRGIDGTGPGNGLLKKSELRAQGIDVCVGEGGGEEKGKSHCSGFSLLGQGLHGQNDFIFFSESQEKVAEHVKLA
jgi:hypothetical protein